MKKLLKRVTRATDLSARTLHIGVAALDPETLHQEAHASVQALLEEGQSENTARAYAGALRYWAAWFHLRYRATLALPVPVPVVLTYFKPTAAGLKEARDAHGTLMRLSSGLPGLKGQVA